MTLKMTVHYGIQLSILYLKLLIGSTVKISNIQI